MSESSESLPRRGGARRLLLLWLVAWLAVAVALSIAGGLDPALALGLLLGAGLVHLVVILALGRGRVPAGVTVTEIGMAIPFLFGLWALFGEGLAAFVGLTLYWAWVAAWRFVVPSGWLRAPKPREGA